MDSRSPHPDPAHPHAAEIVTAATARGLGSRRRLRLLAIAAWCSFLGAALLLLGGLAVFPTEGVGTMGLGELSIAFLCAWALTLIPVSLALLLATDKTPHHPHGR